MTVYYVDPGYWTGEYSPVPIGFDYSTYYVVGGYWNNDYSPSWPVPVPISPENFLPVSKYLEFLHRIFDKDPHQFLAMRLNYDGGMSWNITNNLLKTSVSGGTGVNLSINLADHTVATLAGYITSQPGYSLSYQDGSTNSSLSARILIDGANDQSFSNGDHIYGYTSLLWAFLSAIGSELSIIKQEIVNAITQMNMLNATDYWLDLWGSYYGFPRNVNEIDVSYAPRIVAQVLMPRGNNVAIESALFAILGQQVSVVDVVDYGSAGHLYNGFYSHNAAIFYDNTGALPKYALFDVNYSYNLESGQDLTGYATQLRALIEQLRDAGTQLRTLNLQSSGLADNANLVSTDTAQITITYSNFYDGSMFHDGSGNYSGVAFAVTETLS